MLRLRRHAPPVVAVPVTHILIQAAEVSATVWAATMLLFVLWALGPRWVRHPERAHVDTTELHMRLNRGVTGEEVAAFEAWWLQRRGVTVLPPVPSRRGPGS